MNYVNVMDMRRLLLGVAFCMAIAPGIALRAAAIGDAAPAFTLPDRDAKAVSLASLRGQVVYLDFWASWCGPCRKSFPWMNAMQQKYGSAGLVVVAVNVDKRIADANRFLALVPARFSTVFDDSGATPEAYGVKAMPSSLLIDRNGKVALVEEGFRDERRAELEARIRALLAQH